MSFRKLWNDEAGFIVSAELVLIATILVIGMIVGLIVIRNQVVQELVDVGQAIGRTCQTYGYLAVVGAHDTAFTCGASYSDRSDFCEAADVADAEPGGISVQTPPQGETDAGAAPAIIP